MAPRAFASALLGPLLVAILSAAELSSPSPTCPGGVCPGLGHLFYLPDVNAKAISTGGRLILKNTKVGTCATISKTEQSTRSFMSEDSMDKLVKVTSTSVGVTGSYKTAELSVKGSVSALTGSSSSVTTTFHSTHLDITSVTHVVDLDQTDACIGPDKNFVDDILTTFEAIPQIEAKDVSSNSAWAPYVNFLKDRGSHVMTQQKIGSRLQQWESTTTSTKNVAETLQVKACASVEGGDPNKTGWSVSACGAYNKSQKEDASKTQSQSVRVILGGTKSSRTGLTQELSQKTLNEFIADAEQGDQPIDFSFKPLWEILIDYYTTKCATSGKGTKDCQHKQRAYNMQAAYEGWTAVGCSKLTTTNNVVYQVMAVQDATTDTKTYQCVQAKTGCSNDDDCHLGGSGSECYCYGPSCFDEGDPISGTSDKRTKVRGSESGSYTSGINNACYYKFIAHCDCDTKWSDGLKSRTIYQQGTGAEENMPMLGGGAGIVV